MHQSSYRNLFTLCVLPAILIGLAARAGRRRAPERRRASRAGERCQNPTRDRRRRLSRDRDDEYATGLGAAVDSSAGTFRMAFEERFLTAVDQDELKAIVAHELGHVWIFTHHPYLQTERLANTVAIRAVPRPSLERVYSKVWAREGTRRATSRLPRCK